MDSSATTMPRRLGPYSLCMEIAAGGMGTVYLACIERSAGIREFVAVKRLHPRMVEDRHFLEMFFDEVCITSQIHHPNVCRVIDFAAERDGHFLAMEYLVGEPLAAVGRVLADTRKGSPAHRVFRVLRVMADVCEGLHAAHELRDLSGRPLHVVHRDVSPENIFITYDGAAKIVDFGVASAARQKHHTRAGVVKGKLAYMPPEGLRGLRPDRRGDVWALGVVLREMLTLRRLFKQENDVDTYRAVLEGKVPAPSKVCPGVPPEIDAVVARALAREPEQRYPTARKLGRELARVLARRREAIGAPEIADWMDELFPGGRERKRRLLEVAAQLGDADADVKMQPPPIPAPEPERSVSIALSSSDLSLPTPHVSRLRGLARVAIAVLVLFATAGVSYGLWRHGRPLAPPVLPGQYMLEIRDPARPDPMRFQLCPVPPATPP